jgi:hypothetical protein
MAVEGWKTPGPEFVAPGEIVEVRTFCSATGRPLFAWRLELAALVRELSILDKVRINIH